MDRLRQTLEHGLLDLDVNSSELEEILGSAVSIAAAEGLVPEQLREDLLSELLQREQRYSTAIGNAVAVPHAYLDGVTRSGIVFLRLRHPVNMGAPDGIPTQFLFVLTGPPGEAQAHLDTLTHIARLMSDDEFRYDLGTVKSQQDLLAALDRFEQRTVPPAPAAAREEVTPGLVYTGRLAGGLIADVKRRLPHYASDFKDGLHPKTATAILFMFFACIAPAITFGGLMYEITGQTIGVAEMLVGTALCGVVFALIGGQPLVILGGTGPNLVFTAILYQLCRQMEVPFLETYVWVGLWTALFLIILAVTDASCLIRYFTRFTDEIFAALISLIFIAEALKSILGYVHGAQSENLEHDVAFLSLILALGTFIVAMLLSRIRNSRYLKPKIREFLADFGPTLAIVLMIAFGRLFPAVRPAPLDVPETFSTTTGRPWLVDPTGVDMWVWFAASIPALLLTVLIDVNQNITARLVNSRQHNLQKGEAYHLDVGVLGVLIAVCSVLGLPWVVAAVVRSLNHVRSLATIEEVISPHGNRHERVIHVRENRIAPLAIHLMIAGSLFFLPLLQLVPKAILYGVFLYMGIVSIAGNQFFERVNLWLMDPDLYPRTHYTRRVPIRVIHAFTALQMACLAALWLVKESPIGIAFPVFIALLVTVRMLASRWFAPEHLDALDAEELPEEEIDEWT
jgi:mannitol/fructose-specific phosphotransferase system IIA component (Ntr-type)